MNDRCVQRQSTFLKDVYCIYQEENTGRKVEIENSIGDKSTLLEKGRVESRWRLYSISIQLTDLFKTSTFWRISIIHDRRKIQEGRRVEIDNSIWWQKHVAGGKGRNHSLVPSLSATGMCPKCANNGHGGEVGHACTILPVNRCMPFLLIEGFEIEPHLECFYEWSTLKFHAACTLSDGYSSTTIT